MNTDIVFSRANYCKVDLMVASSRGEALFRQEAELERLNRLLADHGLVGGVGEVIAMAEGLGTLRGKHLRATTDAKFLELGMGTKSDNVDFFLETLLEPAGISPEECCFWGDEFSSLGPGVPGSDALMITERSRRADFFDVSPRPEELPGAVKALGGQVERFLVFLDEQSNKVTAD